MPSAHAQWATTSCQLRQRRDAPDTDDDDDGSHKLHISSGGVVVAQSGQAGTLAHANSIIASPQNMRRKAAVFAVFSTRKPAQIKRPRTSCRVVCACALQ